MAQSPQLRIPGPTPVPARVQRAMDAPMINHRGPEFKALLPELESVLKRHNRLLVVDGVSSIGSIDLPVDRWGVDVAVTASQKGWMLPPGLTMLSVSPAAWERQKRATAPRFYFDWERARAMQAKGMTFTTPALGIMFGLREALTMMREEGLEAVFQRHRRIASAFRAAATALGLRLLADPEVASHTVTAVYLPEELWGNSEAVFKVWRDLGLVLGEGQGRVAGKIFRIGHLGSVYDADVIATVEALERGLHKNGVAIKPGAALTAAQRALQSSEPSLVA